MCLVLAVVAAIAGVAYREVRAAARTGAAAHLESVSRQLAELFGTSARQIVAEASGVATDSAVVSFVQTRRVSSRAVALRALERLAANQSAASVAELWDSAGDRILATRHEPPLPEQTIRSLVARGAVGADDRPGSPVGFIGPIDTVAGKIGYQVIAPVEAPRARHPIGFVVQRRLAGVDARQMSQLTALIGPESALLFGNTGGTLWTDLRGAVVGPPTSGAASGGISEYELPGRGAVIAAVTPIPNTPWSIAVESPQSLALAPAHDMLWRLALVTVGLLGLAAVGAWVVSGTLTKPIRHLAVAAEAFTAGNYSHRLPATRRDELGAFAAVFNTMAERIAATLGALGHKVTELEDAESRYRLLFEANPQPMWVYDLETQRFLAVNAAAIDRYGFSREEFLAMRILDVRPPEDVPALLADLLRLGRDGSAHSDVWRHRTADGTVIDVEVSSRPLDFAGRPARLVLVNDLTERRRLELQLRQSQKMEAVGRLAGGVAHDFNNLLTVMLAECQMMIAAPDMAAVDRADSIGEIHRAAERAAMLTRQLLTFSRQQLIEATTLDVNDVVRDVDKMLRRLIGEDIDLRLKLVGRPALTLADRGQIEQVIVNLAVNARDAMPQGGALTIETQLVTLDQAYCDARADVTPGPYVLLGMSDTGTGMDESVRARVFEPFFTTKEPGKGTGLGLATCYAIAQQFQGHIAVYSEVGIGTTIKVYLPYTPVARSEPAEPARQRASDGTETILLVEDDSAVRRITAKLLVARGYTVLQAGDAEQALILFNEHRDDIRLLLTDVVLPRLGGRELAERITAVRPTVRVLFASGYSADIVLQHRLTEHDVMLIQKPFTAEALAIKVREALAQR